MNNIMKENMSQTFKGRYLLQMPFFSITKSEMTTGFRCEVHWIVLLLYDLSYPISVLYISLIHSFAFCVSLGK